jgi:hypothetical protein
MTVAVAVAVAIHKPFHANDQSSSLMAEGMIRTPLDPVCYFILSHV